MKKKNRLFCLLFIVCALLFVGVACQDKGKKDVIKGKISDVVLTVNDTEFNFYDNVSFVDENGKRMEFTCNESVVSFGTAGKYAVIYQVGDLRYERIVYIYGAPTITVVNPTVAYADAYTKDFSAYVVATDTFGKALPLTYNSGLSYDANGGMATGTCQFEFSATDDYGNKKTESVTLNVQPSTDLFTLGEVTIDYVAPYYTVEVGARKVISVYCDGEELDSSFYVSNNGFLMLTPEFAKKFGVTTGKEVFVNFDTCTARGVIAITDSQPAAYKAQGDVNGKNFFLLDEIALPVFEKVNASIQDVTFAYYIERNQAKTPISDEVFIPQFGGEYFFVTEIYRNGSVVEEIKQAFEVSHYSESVIGLSEYLVMGTEYDVSVQTDLSGLDVAYTFVDTDGIFSRNGNKITPTKEGTASVTVNINNGELEKTLDVKVVDFYNSTGKTRDFAKTTDVWSGAEPNAITYQTGVADLRTTAKQYSFDALKAAEEAKLSAGLIEAAVAVGYQYLTFTAFVDNEETPLNLYCFDGEVYAKVASYTNGGRWQYNAFDLKNWKEGTDLAFEALGANVYLAKVEFIGVDISDYASTVITASATDGRSVDLINGDTWGKILQTVCNTNNTNEYTDTGMDKVSATDNGDYISFTRSGYVSTYGRVENSIYVSAEWIMAARKLGYSVIGIWMGHHEGYSMIKRKVDGTLISYKNNGKEWHAGISSDWGFISLDISNFEDGETIIISLSGENAKVAGVTFRTMEYAVPNLRAD